MIVVDAKDAADPEAGGRRRSRTRWLRRDGVVSVSPAMFNEAGDTAIFDVVPSTSPTDAATKDLVQRPASMRDRSSPTAPAPRSR